MRKGWIRGKTCTAIPTRSRFVRVAIEQATMIGAESTERLGLKCISPNHTVSNPDFSAKSTSSKDSLKASSGVPPGRNTKSRNIPKSIHYPLSWPDVFDQRLSASIDLRGHEGKLFANRSIRARTKMRHLTAFKAPEPCNLWPTTRPPWSAFTRRASRSKQPGSADDCACDAVRSVITMSQPLGDDC